MNIKITFLRNWQMCVYPFLYHGYSYVIYPDPSFFLCPTIWMNGLYVDSHEWTDIPGSGDTGSGESTSSGKMGVCERVLSTWPLTSRSGMAFIRLAWVCWRILSISFSASGPAEWTVSSATARFETCGEPKRSSCLSQTNTGKVYLAKVLYR